jgi:hypothetical protein
MLLILLVVILIFGFGGYRRGPGLGYYGGGLDLIIVLLYFLFAGGRLHL